MSDSKELRGGGRVGLDSWEHHFWDCVKANYKAACEHMDENKLTKDQQFSVAVMSGVEWRLGGMFGTTPVTVPCSISVVDGKWFVVSKDG